MGAALAVLQRFEKVRPTDCAGLQEGGYPKSRTVRPSAEPLPFPHARRGSIAHAGAARRAPALGRSRGRERRRRRSRDVRSRDRSRSPTRQSSSATILRRLAHRRLRASSRSARARRRPFRTAPSRRCGQRRGPCSCSTRTSMAGRPRCVPNDLGRSRSSAVASSPSARWRQASLVAVFFFFGGGSGDLDATGPTRSLLGADDVKKLSFSVSGRQGRSLFDRLDARCQRGDKRGQSSRRPDRLPARAASRTASTLVGVTRGGGMGRALLRGGHSRSTRRRR